MAGNSGQSIFQVFTSTYIISTMNFPKSFKSTFLGCKEVKKKSYELLIVSALKYLKNPQTCCDICHRMWTVTFASVKYSRFFKVSLTLKILFNLGNLSIVKPTKTHEFVVELSIVFSD